MKSEISKLLAQARLLERQAEKLRKKQISEVVKRIKSEIAAYKLTAVELGFAQPQSKTSAATRKGSARVKSGSSRARGKVDAKYRDQSGHQWTGRGKMPVWLRDAIASGRRLEEFKVSTVDSTST